MMKFMNTTSSAVIAAAALMGMASQASADIQHLDDVIIENSLCVGQDCNNGENFGFDTVRLKENNLRIHFNDTSNSASFPSRDWRIVINDSGNGGANYFAIEDTDGGVQPFRIEASAPASSLYVNSGGRVGFGTSNPVVEMHVSNGDTPTLRLEQSGASGFTPQTWDIAGNETNFFIRDVTNGSRLSFRIQPGAPESTVYLASSGNVGMGTSTPSEALHIRGTDGDTTLFIDDVSGSQGSREMIRMSNNGGSYMTMLNTQSGHSWYFTNENNAAHRLLIDNTEGAGIEFALGVDGNLAISGELTTAGSCSGGCDRVFTPEYELASIDQHSATMWQSGYLPGVGPTPEDGPFNITAKVGGILNELEHAHIYIDQLNARVTELENRIVASNQAD